MKMITRLAVSNNKKNKTRSVLLMAAIFLTTTLLATIASFGYGNIRYQRENALEFYGNYCGIYKSVTEEQIQALSERGEMKDIGRAAVAGEVENKASISLNWFSEQVIEMVNLERSLEQGTFPKKQEEIAGEAEFFEKLGYSQVKVGDKISLMFRKNKQEKFAEETFVVSGIIESPKQEIENQIYTGYISEEFYNARYNPEERAYNAYFTFSDSVSATSNTAETVAKEVAEKCNINPERTKMNSYYTMWVLDPGTETITGCASVAVIVLLLSLLVIYNIFQVGIVQKIQEYGKIKALGATKKQMKKLVFREGMLLALPVIPAGLIIGVIVTKVFMNFWLKNSGAVFLENSKTEFSPVSLPLLFFCGVVMLLTVWAALKKPMRVVSRISPVEAIRYMENKKQSKGMRKGRRQMTVTGMMTANLAMNKKRTIGTIFTMGLSCVLFVVMANFTGNVDVKYDARKYVAHGKFLISLDYSKNDAAYPENNLDSILKENPLNQGLLDKIEAIDGVTEVITQNLLYGHNVKGELCSVGVLNQEDFENEKRQGGLKGELDYEKASKENSLIYGWAYFMEEDGYQTGQKVKMDLGSRERKADLEGEVQGSFGSASFDWVITEDTYKNLGFTGDSIGKIWVDCKSSDYDKVEEELRTLLEGQEHYTVSTYEGALKTAEASLGMFEALAYGGLLLVGLIAFMNMANTMIISIITRKKELGVLQALGMTNKQLNKMLRSEGILFTMGSIFVSLAVGMPAGYALFCYGRSHSFFGLYIYHIPYQEIIAMILILGAMQLILTYVLSRNVKKESLVERIRYQE